MTDSFEYNKTHNQLDPYVALATVASAMGLASIALLLTVYLSVILGGIAIVLAVLSRNVTGKLLPQAKRAIIFGLIGSIGGYALIANAFVTYFTDPEAHAAINKYTEVISGESFDNTLEGLKKELGLSFD